MSNGQIDEIIGPQQQLSAFLIIIQFTKIYSFLLWEFVHLERISFKKPVDDVMLHYGNF